jgi:hypothetical protein
MGIKFTYTKEIPLNSIGKSTETTTARLEPGLDQVNLNAMIATRERGGDLEAPVLHKGGKLLEILSGNHRISAYRVHKDTHTDAYVVSELSEAAQKLIKRTANILDGKDTKDRSGILAAHAHKETGKSVTLLAKEFGIAHSTVKSYVRVIDVRQALQEEGHNFSRKPLNDSRLNALHPIIKRRGALIPATELVCNKNLNADETKGMAREIEKARDDQEVAEIIAKYHKLFGSRTPGRPLMDRDRNFRRHVNTLRICISTRGFLKNVGKRLTPVEKKDLKERITSLVVSLEDIRKRI